MEITITINGKPVKATIDDKEFKEATEEKRPKKTGYEEPDMYKEFYYGFSRGVVDHNNRYDPMPEDYWKE